MRWYRAYYFEVTVHQVLIESSLFLKIFQTCLGSKITLPTFFILVDRKTKRSYSTYCFDVTVHQILVVIYTL